MADLDKDTVDFVPNYDETTKEPSVLPAPFPNLLVNGSAGIAVGMATNIPPHNLREVIDGTIWMIDTRTCRCADASRRSELLRLVQGPDFPTGGFIVGSAGHRGGVPDRAADPSPSVRARPIDRGPRKGERKAIVIDRDSPIQVNKARLLERSRSWSATTR